jgi:hypothetical protein
MRRETLELDPSVFVYPDVGTGEGSPRSDACGLRVCDASYVWSRIFFWDE